MRSLLVVPIVLGLWLALGACAPHEHLRPDFGKLSQAHFEQQRVYPEAAKNKPQGLDTEEAAIVHATYRKNLGEKAEAPKDAPSRVLLLQEPKGAKEKK